VNISSRCASPPASSLLDNCTTVVVGDFLASLVYTATLFSCFGVLQFGFTTHGSPSEDNESLATFGWCSSPDTFLDEAVAFLTITYSLFGATSLSLLTVPKEFHCTFSLARYSDGSVLDGNNFESFLLADLLCVLGTLLANLCP
jgi:hypothetical protein